MAHASHAPHPAHSSHMAHPSYSHTGAYRDPRDARDLRDMRDPRDVRDPRDPRDPRDIRDMRETVRDPRDMRDMRDPRDVRDARDARDPRELRDGRDRRDPRDARDPRDVRDVREARDPRELRDVRDPRDARDLRDPRDPRELRHTNGGSNGTSTGMVPGPTPIGGPGAPPPGMMLAGPPPIGGAGPLGPPVLGVADGPASVALAAAGTPGPVPAALVNGHARATPPVAGLTASQQRSKERMDSLFSSLAQGNENTWLLIGAVAEQMQDPDRATAAFEHALRHNPNSIIALNSAANIARNKDDFGKAIDYFQRILNIKQDNGEVWGSMGHCLLMKDDLPKAYTAYQQALYHLQNPKEPKLWYGIGILYDRYGSFEHAEEAFSSVLKMDPGFEKANEIYFRLGIIYKHQRRFKASLDCFKYILDNPPRPLTSFDIWFQLGHVYEQNREYDQARDAYLKVLTHQPDHAKVLQQLGWLYHQPGASFADHERAVAYLTKSLETDGSDAQSWYLLGRAFMAGQRYNKAYEAYQQAVYRDGRNPTFWCSIGVLYYQINQYRDALDAYSRAIRLNPYISEVWYNLGSLYESCNNQITDAIDAYSRAAELDPSNTPIKHRLQLLQNTGPASGPLPPAPGPVDVHPSQYAAAPNAPGEPGESPQQPADARLEGLPSNIGGMPAGASQSGMPGPAPGAARDLPPPPSAAGPGDTRSPGPFRGGGAPPPLANVDESRGSMSRLAPLAPMDMDRADRGRDVKDRDVRERDAYREAVRYDERGRRLLSPSSPGQASASGHPAGPSFNSAGPPGLTPRAEMDREPRSREEWEARERECERERGFGRLPLGPPSDPRDPLSQAGARGPSPRVPERLYADPRNPSPRMEQRDYREAGPGHPHAPGSGERERYPQDRYDRSRYDEAGLGDGTPVANGNGGGNGFRHPSISRDAASARGGSPAPSNAPSNASTSRAGGKRGRDRDSEAPKSNKRARDADVAAGMAARKISATEDRGPRKAVESPEVKGERPRTRSVEEEYDEGIEALMALHGDRPTPLPRAESSTPAPINASTGSGLKRHDPPSPTSASAEHVEKRIKPEQGEEDRSPAARPPLNPQSSGNAGPASRTTSTTSLSKKTVIEVLNPERVTTPITEAVPESGMPGGKEAEVPAATGEGEREKQQEKGGDAMEVDAPAVVQATAEQADAPAEASRVDAGGDVTMDGEADTGAKTVQQPGAADVADGAMTEAPSVVAEAAAEVPIATGTAPVDEDKDELDSRPATPPMPAAPAADSVKDKSAAEPASDKSEATAVEAPPVESKTGHDDKVDSGRPATPPIPETATTASAPTEAGKDLEPTSVNVDASFATSEPELSAAEAKVAGEADAGGQSVPAKEAKGQEVEDKVDEREEGEL